jgi:2-desacetyl-2-hydroxyethyl bacteriochlorophyllide A dehydrogenase
MPERIARYMGSGTVLVEESGSASRPGPGQVRIDVAYTGICGTDLHILHGAMDHRVKPPSVIGHEMSGRIAEVGPGVSGWVEGAAVTVMPLDWCGSCPACWRGHRHICQRLNFVGIDSPGCMQSSWIVSADWLVPLPAELSLQHAALAEPTAVAVHDVRRSGLVAGEKALVVGGGPVGLLVALVAQTVGADVRVLEISPDRRAVAVAAGLAVLDAYTEDVASHVDAWTDGAGADVAFEVSGSGAGVATATEVLAVRGRLVMVAIHSAPREMDLFRLFWRELTVVGARVYERTDFDRAIALLASGAVPATPLISSVLPLEYAAEAFAALERGTVVKVLLACGGS